MLRAKTNLIIREDIMKRLYAAIQGSPLSKRGAVEMAIEAGLPAVERAVKRMRVGK